MNIKNRIWRNAAVTIVMALLYSVLSLFLLKGPALACSLGLAFTGMAAACLASYRTALRMQTRLAHLTAIAEGMKEGTPTDTRPIRIQDEWDELVLAFHSLSAQFRARSGQEHKLRLEAEEQAWINQQVSEMAILLQGSVKVEAASAIFLNKLAAAVQASYGVLYVRSGQVLHFAAGYACGEPTRSLEPIPMGSGLVGQCALEKEILERHHLPEGYIKVSSALGEASPASLTIIPVLYEEELVAVLELASFLPYPDKERQLIDRVSRNLGVLLHTLADVARIDELLRETQNQKEELEAQTEELLAQTDELHAQTEELHAQTEELQEQAQELASSNGRLKREMELTARQKEELQQQNEEVHAQAEELQTQAEELRVSMEMAVRQKEEIERQALELKTQADSLRLSNEQLAAEFERTAKQKEEIERQARELKEQADEILASNEQLKEQIALTERQKEEIAAQADEVLAQAEELQSQADELQVQTEELADTNENLLRQMEITERQKLEIKAQADEIYLAAQHKSEFLANVSHELRTPLNSLLILSQILAENKEGNLQAKQLEYVHTIFSAGKDLLQLIDEILDLAKLETGKMLPVLEPTELHELADSLYRSFEHQAQKRSLTFDVRMDRTLPESIITDGHRLRQVLRNLIANALKFTETGSVSLEILRGNKATRLRQPAAAGDIVFAVTDTGIGIPSDKLEAIFEAFQQADGTTSRKYGGTGLGLTISRELAGLLGGRIEVYSEEGGGSVFSLVLPAVPVEAAEQAETESLSIAAAAEHASKDKASFMESFIPDISISNPKLLQFSEMEDDRADLQPEDTVLLIIEDEKDFASILLELARRRGFKAIVAFQGDQGLALAHAYKPDAILLDTDLPVLDGWAIISRLKSRPELRHIPVHVISTEETDPHTLSLGALSFWKKPSDHEELEAAFLQIESYIRRQTKNLLIVEDHPDLRKSLVAFIAHPDVRITAVATGREALEQLTVQHFDCMVLDLGLSDLPGFDLLEQIKTNRKLQTLPVIIYTGKELSKHDEQRLKHYAESIVIKNVRSMERLYDETALYLHRRTADLPPDKQRLIEKLHNPESAFEGRRILLVDDDMRNIFALSSVLEGYNMEIRFAQNGREALSILDEEKEIELIFMDIMMPEMDGYETMREIRRRPEYENVVIIALTARAMEEDRVKCLQAGASDYIPKPINTTQLVTMLKAWLIK
ncbi:response regulator [Paenibacillus aurantius]|uniref:Circadian input-output histidine kinase CikA n=1 Tax=Paenibacillus aurantius TaxID=2918900 RepID=A0AA96LGJ0_9BACL|nr:response regulator [Paenibacillus aurantius]WNQ12870.1 response regulator [Paenibacillus aurantius]